MTTLGTPFSTTATRVLLCGSGELGKEVAIELQRLGCEVIAVDRYKNAPAMQVADRSHAISMLDGQALRSVIELEKPDYIVPEIEAIATDTLAELEREGFNVVPTARATQLTMNREGIRRLAAETLGLPTSSYHFAASKDEYLKAIQEIGLPCLVKPIMSSSGKGQSIIKTADTVDAAWEYAQEGGRAGKGKVIVEGFVDFDFEITLLTIRHNDANGQIVTSFCEPIGHRQQDGDYQESWQPQGMTDLALKRAQQIAKAVTDELGGRGLFGVELFIKGDDVIFSEVSPRPHDTGLVTLISQGPERICPARPGYPWSADSQHCSARAIGISGSAGIRRINPDAVQQPGRGTEPSRHPTAPVRQTGSQRQTPPRRRPGPHQRHRISPHISQCRYCRYQGHALNTNSPLQTLMTPTLSSGRW